MQDSFGARLRRRREEQNIPLATIADQTKIKLTLLEALERDDVRHWPAGIFRRAFIRAYAHAIGLNPDDVVREFIEVHPEPEDIAAAAAIAAAIESERPNGSSPGSLRSIVGSAFGSFTRRKRTAETVQPTPVVPPTEVARTNSESVDTTAEFDALMEMADFEPVAPPDLTLPREEPAPEPPVASSCSAEPEQAVVPSWSALKEPVPAAPDLSALASLCTDFGRVENADEVQPLLQRAAGLLDASGLIVWLWDGAGQELKPALVHGYSDRVLAQLPGVRRSDDNPTAAAFRSGTPCAVGGRGNASGALALPLLAPGGCAGVLAIELQQGTGANTESACAVATILASLLAQLVGGARTDEMPAGEAPTQAAARTGDVTRLSAAVTH